jgi:hypothetical protein
MTHWMDRQDLRAHFDEYAAIIEFDHRMSRADAEALAVAKLYDDLQACPPLGIIAELARAAHVRHCPQLRDCLQACGLVDVRGPAWGFDWCVFDGSTYRPDDPDEPRRSCLIVPSTEDGALVDLVAMDLADRRMTTRLGVAGVVGADAIDCARQTQKPLFIFDDPTAWLRGCTRGAIVVDWMRASYFLDGIKLLKCSRALAPRLYAATRTCGPVPKILIPAMKLPHVA